MKRSSYCLRLLSHSAGCIFFLCECILAFELNVFEHHGQLYNAPPVCTVMCSRSVTARLNALPQMAH
uniref:Putative secreted protein n=1 Tax=Anopheles marajoara TaxID=58244 RepID=A0A2M4CFT5_9DIPT